MVFKIEQIKRIVYVFVIIAILAAGCNDNSNSAYVELIKVYKEFDFTKELKQEIGKRRQYFPDKIKMENRIDSISKLFEEEKDKQIKINYLNQIDQLKKDFFKRKEDFLRSQKVLEQRYDKQIWDRINQYVTEFGKKNGYKYIFGADGSGSLMYADSTNNITDEVIDYINRKYNDN